MYEKIFNNIESEKPLNREERLETLRKELENKKA